MRIGGIGGAVRRSPSRSSKGLAQAESADYFPLTMDAEYLRANRENWNERATLHAPTKFYDLDGFVAEKRTGLHPTEAAEMGSVQGKSLVQLQCHLGIETLAWARMGATRVVGLDFSETALAHARSLAERCDLGDRAQFVLADVHDAPTALRDHAPFDIVYVSVGALLWLPSVRRWAEICAAMLSVGGALYVREVHPMTLAVNEESGQLIVKSPYFERAEPERWDDARDYADPAARLTHPVSYEWNRGLGEIVQALVDAGFAIELLHEHRDAEWQAFSHMTTNHDGLYELPEAQRDHLPLTFSLRARKTR
jgi:SAM-dependent methyltransferase